jgi:hypothetical protein
LYDSGKKIFIAEQNNGYLYSQIKDVLFKAKKSIDTEKIYAINVLDSELKPQFIHSATYTQLLHQFGLSPEQLAETIKKNL